MKVLILAGGGGSRLWPLSRQTWPKQFLNLAPTNAETSLLLDTIQRCVCESVSLDEIYIITGAALLPLLERELRRADLENLLPNVICEPMRRNTAPAIALAACYIQEKTGNTDDILAVLPADHAFSDTEGFQSQLAMAMRPALDGSIVTLGIEPTRPETGYGYIQVAEQLLQNPWIPVTQFVEKPDYKTACKYLESGCYFWNSGIFLMRLNTLQNAFRTHSPEIARLTDAGYRQAYTQFAAMPDISIDYAIMEKSDNIVVMPLQTAWSDMGCWDNVHEMMPQDDNGNVVRGDNLQPLDTRNTLIWSETKRHIATIGLDGCLIVDTPDALLISAQGQSQQVKEIVKALESGQFHLPESQAHEKQERWGSLSSLAYADESTLQPSACRLCIKPNQTIQITVDKETQWCLQSGNGVLYTRQVFKVLQPDVFWTQKSQEITLLQTGELGATLLSMGARPVTLETNEKTKMPMREGKLQSALASN
jgi:mannose-1-phosphate guanylyltransferase/mannose-6-phosphate isomerase